MKAALAALFVVLLQGCSLGVGSSYVGQWTRHERVSFRACEEAQDGSCSKETDVTTTVPARRFVGLSVMVGAMGPSTAWSGENVHTSFRLALSTEALIGYGRFAIGLRADAIFPDVTTSSVIVPVHAVGHIGISERFSAYGAFGWAPYASLSNEAFGFESERSRSIIRGLLGLQTVLVRSSEEARLVLDFQVDWMHATRDVDYDVLGFTLNLGFAI